MTRYKQGKGASANSQKRRKQGGWGLATLDVPAVMVEANRVRRRTR